MNYFHQESQNLVYRKLREEDIPLWLGFFVDNENLPFLGIDLTQSHRDLAESWIRAQFNRYEEQGLGHLAVELKETGEFIGMGGILPRLLMGTTEYEIAYSLLPKFWNFGFATEIAIKMKDYAIHYMDIESLISIIHIENIASAVVARKNGMKVKVRTDYLGMTVDVFGINIKKK